MEGVGCFLTGLCGPGVGVTSYSENIGAIALTKVTNVVLSFLSCLFKTLSYEQGICFFRFYRVFLLINCL